MVCFQTKNPNLGKFWSALEKNMLVYFTVIWNILWSFGIFLWPFGKVVVIWYIFTHFGIHIVTRKIWQPYIQKSVCLPTRLTGLTFFV
jgi:hypothetical protein